ncbi:hypothetical protein [Streptomyces sp. IBSNAI001]|uniref:hypothetical protein n=1 Tax=Streptomyces sp. IBSNAI001 TaxID=3457499 RepID=UPI003FD5A805
MGERTRAERAELHGQSSKWDLVEELLDAEDRAAELRKLYIEARADATYFEEWATSNGRRLNAKILETDRYRLAWLSARRRAADEANLGMEALELKQAEIVRLKADKEAARDSIYRLAADRLRIDHEATDLAVQLADAYQEIARLNAAMDECGDHMDALRESTCAAQLESVGVIDGDEVYRLKRS